MRRLRVPLLLLLLAVAPGCRAIATAATFVGAAFIEGALDSDDDYDYDRCDERRDRRAATPNPSRRSTP